MRRGLGRIRRIRRISAHARASRLSAFLSVASRSHAPLGGGDGVGGVVPPPRRKSQRALFRAQPPCALAADAGELGQARVRGVLRGGARGAERAKPRGGGVGGARGAVAAQTRRRRLGGERFARGGGVALCFARLLVSPRDERGDVVEERETARHASCRSVCDGSVFHRRPWLRLRLRGSGLRGARNRARRRDVDERCVVSASLCRRLGRRRHSRGFGRRGIAERFRIDSVASRRRSARPRLSSRELLRRRGGNSGLVARSEEFFLGRHDNLPSVFVQLLQRRLGLVRRALRRVHEPRHDADRSTSRVRRRASRRRASLCRARRRVFGSDAHNPGEKTGISRRVGKQKPLLKSAPPRSRSPPRAPSRRHARSASGVGVSGSSSHSAEAFRRGRRGRHGVNGRVAFHPSRLVRVTLERRAAVS